MANVNLISTNGHLSYGLKHFVCKEASNVDDLPKTVRMGSIAHVIATSEDYMFDGVNWVLQKSSGSPTTIDISQITQSDDEIMVIDNGDATYPIEDNEVNKNV